MASKYTTIPIRDFGLGLDQEAAESQIPEGFVEDSINADPLPEGAIAKRRGYEGHAGWVPLRVKRLVYTDADSNNFQLFFDESINLSNFRSSPLIIHGRTSAQNTSNIGDFPNDQLTTKYYPNFVSSEKRTFGTGSNSFLLEGDGDASLLWTGVSRSTSTANNSNEVIWVDSISQNQSNNEITLNYVNSGNAFQGYIYLADKSASLGNTYNTAPTAQPASTTTTNLITIGTHGLSNTNLIVKAFHDTGSAYEEIRPESVIIKSNGDVEVVVDNQSTSPINVIFSLSTCPATNLITGSVAGEATTSVVISDLESDFLFTSCYLEDLGTGDREEVLPDSIVVDATSKTATITFINSSTASANFFVYWEEAELTSNKASLGAGVIGTGFEDTEPQLTVWGISHEGLYSPSSPRGGWVSHIDSYKSSTLNTLLCGLGGNFYSEAHYSNPSDRSTFLLPSYATNLRARISSPVVIGPTLIPDSGTSNRTRGYLSSSGVDSTNTCKVSSIWWDPISSTTKVLLELPAYSSSTTLSSLFSTEDYLTLSNVGFPIHEGSFPILGVTGVDGDFVEVEISNPLVTNGDWNEFNSSARAGIFTDFLTLSSNSQFLGGDLIKSQLFEEVALSLTAIRSTTSTLVVSGATSELSIPSGLRIAGKRNNSRILPLRTTGEVESNDYLVKGDMVTFSTLEDGRKLRIVGLNTNSDLPLTITGDGEQAVATLGSGTTDFLTEGDYLLLIRAGDFEGEVRVTSILDESSFTFSSPIVGTSNGTIKGKTATIDEVLPSWEDSPTENHVVTVETRWKPVELPPSEGTLLPTTHPSHRVAYPFDNQPLERSTMVSDSLLITNGEDEVLKFDGQYISQAGLPKWQPSLFVVTDTTPASGGEVVLDTISLNVSSISGNTFSVTSGQEVQLSIGDRIKHSSDGATYVVTNLGIGTVSVNKTISSGTPGTLSKFQVRRYYFRLNLIDANRNLVGSAVASSEDFAVALSESAQIRLRLIGLPNLGSFDFERMELEVYGTKFTGVPPFYRLATIPLNFNINEGYVDFVDTNTDDTLNDLDLIQTALKGAELGTSLSAPPRAKVLTSSDNRLILGNVRGYPELNIRMIPPSNSKITTSTLASKKFTFRRDNTKTGVVTDNADTFTFEFTTSKTSITPGTDLTNDSGNGFTVTSTAHGLSKGDWVYLFHSSIADGSELTYAGWWRIDSVTANTFSIAYPHPTSYTPSATDVDSYAVATNSKDIPVFLGTDGNYSTLSGNREAGSSYEFLAALRLSHAINTSQRMNGSAGFKAFMVANAGNDYSVGQLIVSQPFYSPLIMEVELPTFTSSEMYIYMDGIEATSGEQSSAITRLFPSRLLVSYPNYPEIFDNPFTPVDSESESAIDINAADGQEIRAVIPFFGDSAFGSSQKGALQVVGKENSLYIVDLNAKAAGLPCVQRLETNGVGISSPGSVTVTKAGIQFVHSSGIYRLNRSLVLEFVGRKLGRYWKRLINRDEISLTSAHNYVENQQWRLSFPPSGSSSNSEMFTYNHTREAAQGIGSWTRYTNIPATLWANFNNREAFFGSTRGDIFRLRNSGTATDYRDDASPIDFEVTLRAVSFGDSGIRKVIGSLIAHFRSLVAASSIEFLSATNLSREFHAADPFTLDGDEGTKAQSIRFSLHERRANFFQFQLKDSSLDTPIELTHIDLRVQGLSQKGIQEANSTNPTR